MMRPRRGWIACLCAAMVACGAVAQAQESKGIDEPSGESVEALPVGGPDTFGYIFIDSAEPLGPAFSWVDITATGSSVALGDDASQGPNPLGFTFDFYGTGQTGYFIGSNGQVTFGAGDTDFTNPCPMPDGVEPVNPTIALMWDDLDPGDGGELAYWESFAAGACPYVPSGVAGSPACEVILYEDYAHFPGPAPPVAGTWEAILYDTGDILLQYLDSGDESGSGSITGIAPGPALDGNGLTYACDTAGSITDSLAVLFCPPGNSCGIEADLEVTKTGSASGDQITWTVTVTNNGPADATGVVVTDPLDPCTTYVSDDCGGMNMPPWTWNVGNLANGASATCNIVVDASGCPVGQVSNTATATGNEADPAPGNEAATAAVGVGNLLEIPTLDVVGLTVLLLVLAAAALFLLRRRLTA